MELEWGWFRQLYEGLHRNRDDRLRYLAGNQATAAEHLAELAPLGKRELTPAGGYTGDDEQLWRIMKLYALSRVSDHLIEQIGPHFDGLGVYTDFFTAVGLVPFDHAGAFSPFHHEIAAVVPDPTATEVTVQDVLWPGFFFGDLLFSRAGVRVRAPGSLIDAHSATTSTLYFTDFRGSRPANDLSHGWGSNSQWRTSFPRFYADDEGFHFNWDGEVDIGDDPPARPPDEPPGEEPLDERREVLLHRCFVRKQPPADEGDRYPYDDRMSVRVSEWPLRPEAVRHVRWTG